MQRPNQSNRNERSQTTRISIKESGLGHNSTVMSIVFRASMFVVYLGLSITLLVYAFNHGDKCWTRSTYTPVSMDSFGGSEMYTGMGVISRPQESMVTYMRKPDNNVHDHASDISAFPIVPAQATRDAAFLTVALGNGGTSLAGFIVGAMESPGMAFASAIGAEASMARALARLNVPGITVDGGTVPNLSRCVSKAPSNTKDDLVALEKRIMDVGTASHSTASCVLSGQQRMVDVSSHPKVSLVPFSSTNIMYVCMTVLWLTASFSLFSLQNGIRGLEDVSQTSAFWIPDVFVTVCIAWNVGLVVISCVGIFMDDRVPVNNAFASLGLALVTIAWHTKRTDWDDVKDTWYRILYGSPMNPSGPEIVNEKSQMMKRYPGFAVASHASQNNSIPPIGFGSGINMSANPSRFGRGIYNSIGRRIKKATFNGKTADEKDLLFEFTVTTPIFLASLMAAMSPSATTPIVMAAFGTTLAFFVLSQAALSYRNMMEGSVAYRKVPVKKNREEFSYNDDGTPKFVRVDAHKYIVIFFLVCAMCITGSLSITLVQYDTTFKSSGYVLPIFWILQVTQGLFILVFFMAQFDWYTLFPTEEGEDTMFDWRCPAYSVVNFAQKLVISCMVINMFYNGMFPQQSCHFWPGIEF